MPAPASFETPNAVMRTYASPEHTGTALAVWRAEMAPGAAGPDHVVDVEQILVVIEGRLDAEVGDETHALAAGDSLVLPAGVRRRLHTAGDAPVAFLACSPGGAIATAAGRDPVTIPWAR
jgi:quercetin dioxygenase-like cupin family protein